MRNYFIKIALAVFASISINSSVAAQEPTLPRNAFTAQLTFLHFDKGIDEIPSLNGGGVTFQNQFFLSLEKHIDFNVMFSYLPSVSGNQRETPQVLHLAIAMDIGLFPFYRSRNGNSLNLTIGVGAFHTNYLGTLNPENGMDLGYSGSSCPRCGYGDARLIIHYGLGYEYGLGEDLFLSASVLGLNYIQGVSDEFERDTKIQISFGLTQQY